MIWTVVIACLFLAGFLFMRSQRSEDSKPPVKDTGLALVEFGNAYPHEAIRQAISSADGNSLFLRLHDGKVGCMRAYGNHYKSHLIEPGAVHVHNTASGKGLALEFVDNAHENGRFEFGSSAEAAEVSLWLLGSLVPAGGIDESPRAIAGDS